MHTNGLSHPKRKNDEKGGEITCICMYLQCNSLSPGLVQHKVRNDSPLAFLLPLSVQDVEIKWGLREIFFCSLQTHVGRIQDDTACYAYVLYVQAYFTLHIYAFQSETSAFVGRAKKSSGWLHLCK